jgi:hypothetical protein
MEGGEQIEEKDDWYELEQSAPNRPSTSVPMPETARSRVEGIDVEPDLSLSFDPNYDDELDADISMENTVSISYLVFHPISLSFSSISLSRVD